MLNITKKIYPEGGEKRQMLNKLARSIQVDGRAAFVFQAIEFVLETVAIFSVIGFLAALAGGSLGTAFSYGLWVLSALAALSIQEQFAVNATMAVQVETDPVFAQKLGSQKDNYKRAKWAIFVLALTLNTAGGYIIATSKTFKADTSAIAELDRQYNAEKARIDAAYTSAIASAAMYDAQANEVRKTWKEYAKNKPNEKTYAGIQKEKEVKALMETKQAETTEAAQAKKRELDEAKTTYENQSAALKNAAVDDINKQHRQEWLAFFGSLALSSVLLVLVSVMRTRVAQNEARCGIRYEIQMPSNEEQNVFLNAVFVVKYTCSKIAQTALYFLYSGAAYFSDRRFNFTGYASTKARTEKLDVRSTEAHQNEPEAPALAQVEYTPSYSPKDVPFEVVNDTAPTLDMTGSVSENSHANRRESVGANSVFSVQTSANSDANSEHENNYFSKQKSTSPRRQIAEGGRASDSSVMLVMDGEEYSLRTLKTMRNAYLKRSQDAATRPEARNANLSKFNKINELITAHENSQHAAN